MIWLNWTRKRKKKFQRKFWVLSFTHTIKIDFMRHKNGNCQYLIQCFTKLWSICFLVRNSFPLALPSTKSCFLLILMFLPPTWSENKKFNNIKGKESKFTSQGIHVSLLRGKESKNFNNVRFLWTHIHVPEFHHVPQVAELG